MRLAGVGLLLACVAISMGWVSMSPEPGFSATTPHLLPVQGSVTDSLDQPLPAGNLTVRVYDVSTGGTPLYDSGTDFTGAIVEGRLDVTLGGPTPLNLDNTVLHYMEIHVNGEAMIGEANGGRHGFYPGAGDHSRPDLEARLDTLEAELGSSAPHAGREMRTEAFSGEASGYRLAYGLLGVGRTAGSAVSHRMEANLLLQPVGVFASTNYRLRLGPYYLSESEAELIVQSVQDTIPVLGSGAITVEILDAFGNRLGGRSSILSLENAQGLVSGSGPASENPDTTYTLGFSAGAVAGLDTLTVKAVPATAALTGITPVLVTFFPDRVILASKSPPARIHPAETLDLRIEIRNALGERVPDEGQPFSLTGLGCGTPGAPVSESDSSYSVVYQAGTSACWDTLELFDPEALSFARDSLAIEITDHAIITSVLDVGNDQGRQVRIIWKNDLHDTLGAPTPVTYYVVWRRVDELSSSSIHREPVSTMKSALNALSERREVLLLDAGNTLWEPVGPQIPTQLWTQYASVVPTLADSNVVNGMHHSVFFVSAHTENPQVFFNSEPDSGYSIDNLAPAAPTGLAMSGSGVLTWEEAPEPDFDFFVVYGSSTPSLDGDADVLATTVNPTRDVSEYAYGFYFVTAVDFNGNEGREATVAGVIGVPDPGSLPASFALHQSRPNPSRSVASISFEMPKAGHVRLQVFDSQGRLMSTLADRNFQAGMHSMSWPERQGNGVSAPAGIYFYRLETAEFQSTRKLVFIR